MDNINATLSAPLPPHGMQDEYTVCLIHVSESFNLFVRLVQRSHQLLRLRVATSGSRLAALAACVTTTVHPHKIEAQA